MQETLKRAIDCDGIRTRTGMLNRQMSKHGRDGTLELPTLLLDDLAENVEQRDRVAVRGNRTKFQEDLAFGQLQARRASHVVGEPPPCFVLTIPRAPFLEVRID
jgi:hypothetical protein